MKKTLLSIIALVIAFPTFAQWTTTGSNIYYNSGNVGIGTTIPIASFVISNGGAQGIEMGYSSTLSSNYLESINRSTITSVDMSYYLSGNSAHKFYTQGTERMRIDGSGNIGIGTTSPISLFELKSSAPFLTINGTDNSQFKGINFATNGSVQANILSNIQTGELKIQSGTAGFGGFITYNLDGSEKMRIQAISGNVGIGTINPGSQLDIFHPGTGATLRVGGNATGTSNDASIDLYANNANYVPAYARIALGVNTGSIGSESGYLDFLTINSGSLTEKMRITSAGNVGIGTASPDTKLAVLGTIHANEVKVDLNVPGPDYVFTDNYKLPDLKELKTYLGKNHHLPEIPSAEQMKKNGINLGDMNTKLLQKVEELTLYLIQKDEKDKEKDAQLQSQQEQINELKIQIAKLIKQQ